MAPRKDQPRHDIKKNVAQLAKINLLAPFDDLSLIDSYAKEFGQDPDKVYYDTSFGTIMNFHIMWKEQREYNERYQYIWDEVNRAPAK